jgi:hypothetical protein
MEILVTAKKRIVDPILLHTRVCTKNSGNGYKRSQLAKSHESTLSRISLF